MKRKIAAITAMLASVTPMPGTAIGYMPPMVVGAPGMLTNGNCRTSVAQLNGAGSGATIPFPALALGGAVVRTQTSFTTGGSGTANMALAAQRKAAGLPYEPPTVNPAGAALPATFAADGTDPGPVGWAPYQRMPLTASKRVAEPFGLIFATATSPTRGRIVALTLSMTNRPAAPPRVRLTIDGPSDRDCRPQVIDVYAPSMPAAALAELSKPDGKGCRWFNINQCPRAQWPHGRVLYVSPLRNNTFEYRWIDYDLFGDWHFAQIRTSAENRR